MHAFVLACFFLSYLRMYVYLDLYLLHLLKNVTALQRRTECLYTA